MKKLLTFPALFSFGANKACAIGTTPDCNMFAPPQRDLDYNCDGVLGPNAATGWD